MLHELLRTERVSSSPVSSTCSRKRKRKFHQKLFIFRFAYSIGENLLIEEKFTHSYTKLVSVEQLVVVVEFWDSFKRQSFFKFIVAFLLNENPQRNLFLIIHSRLSEEAKVLKFSWSQKSRMLNIPQLIQNHFELISELMNLMNLVLKYLWIICLFNIKFDQQFSKCIESNEKSSTWPPQINIRQWEESNVFFWNSICDLITWNLILASEWVEKNLDLESKTECETFNLRKSFTGGQSPWSLKNSHFFASFFYFFCCTFIANDPSEKMFLKRIKKTHIVCWTDALLSDATTSEESIYPEKIKEIKTRDTIAFFQFIRKRNNFFYVTNESSSIKWCVSRWPDRGMVKCREQLTRLGWRVFFYFNVQCKFLFLTCEHIFRRCKSSLYFIYVVECCFMIIINNIYCPRN